MEIINKFDNMEFSFTSKISNEIQYECNSECKLTDNKSKQIYGRWNGILDLSGESNSNVYNFILMTNNKAYLYIDNLDEYVLETKSSNVMSRVTIELSKDIHQIMIINYNDVERQDLLLLCYLKRNGELKNGIVKYYPFPLQYIIYPDILIFYKDKYGSYSPTLYGYANAFTATLPQGLSIDENGRIFGTATNEEQISLYEIKGNGIDCSINVKIQLIVIDSKSLYKKGLYCLYYSINEMLDTCSIPIYTSTVIERIYENPINNINEKQWNSLKDYYVIKMTGYILIEENGYYYFRIETNNYLEITINYNSIHSNCDNTLSSGIFTLEKGYLPITILYFKTLKNELPYFKIDYTNIINPYLLKPLNDIFYYLSSLFEYTYSKVEYTKGNSIIPNCPKYYNINSNSKSYSSDPELPEGLSFDNNGCIMGTPLYEDDYTTFTIISTDSDKKYKTTIIIKIISIEAPKNLKYNEIICNLGDEISITPTYNPGDGGIIFNLINDLPLGLELDKYSGRISGIPRSIINNNIIKIQCSNDGGIIESDISITVNKCQNNKYFLDFEYRATSNTMTITINNNNNNMEYYKSNHIEGEIYHLYKCISTSKITIYINSDNKIDGYYRLGIEDDILLDYNLFNYGQTIISSTLTYSDKPSLEFLEKYIFYKNEIIQIKPIKYINGIQSISISNLPSDLTLNDRNDVISGIIRETGNYNIEITIINKYGENNIQLNIEVKEFCDINNGYLSYRINTGNTGKYILFSIQDLNGKIYVSYDGFYLNELIGGTLCLLSGEYIINYGNKGNEIWEDSLIYIDIERKQNELFDNVGGITMLYKNIDIDIKNIDSDNGIEISDIYEENWYKNVNTGWSKYNVNNLPKRSSITRYYKIYGREYYDISNVQSIILTVTFDSGIIIYLNGNIIYKKYLPDDVDFSVKGTVLDKTSKKIYIPNKWFNSELNIIAIETHNYENYDQIDPFSIIIDYDINENEYCNYGLLLPNEYSLTDLYSNVEHMEKFSSAGGLFSVFDRNEKTQLDYTTAENNIELKFLFPKNYAKAIETYGFIPSYDTVDADPKSWIVYGISNNKEIELHEVNDYSITNREKQDFIVNLHNKMIYDGFKVIFNKCGSSNVCNEIRLTEINFYLCKSSICEEDEGFPETRAGDTSIITCGDSYTGYKSRKCTDVGWESIDESKCGILYYF